MSIASLVLGISSIVTCLGIGILPGTLAIIFARYGWKSGKHHNLATAGFVTGVIGASINGLLWLIFLILLLWNLSL